MAIALGKLTLIVGAGLVGTALSKEGRLSDVTDLFSGAFKIVTKHLQQDKDNSRSSGKTQSDSLLIQVNSLREELQLLASSRSVTIVTAGGSGSRTYGVTVVIVVGVMGYAYIWWKGWKLSDMMFVTRRNFSNACTTVENNLTQVSTSVVTLSSWKDRLHGWGYDPLFCSVEAKSGLAALEDILKGQTTVIVGPSGVGKSSLINSLRSSQCVSDEEEHIEGSSKWSGDQRVGTVSERSGKGKHTTRHVSLLPLSGGGYLVDTPGFNQPSLLKVTKKTLAEMFPEIKERLAASESGKCSFSDCLHLGERGCVVKADWERYPYYLQLLDEIKIREEFQLRTLGTKREGEMRYKVGSMGVKQAEPMLEFKKHRRVSRKRINQSILDDLDDIEEVESDTEDW